MAVTIANQRDDCLREEIPMSVHKQNVQKRRTSEAIPNSRRSPKVTNCSWHLQIGKSCLNNPREPKPKWRCEWETGTKWQQTEWKLKNATHLIIMILIPRQSILLELYQYYYYQRFYANCTSKFIFAKTLKCETNSSGRILTVDEMMKLEGMAKCVCASLFSKQHQRTLPFWQWKCCSRTSVHGRLRAAMSWS